MNRPTALYRYITENGRVSKLYTIGGLKQVIRAYDKDFARYPSGYYDTSKWVIERIPIKADRFISPSVFLEEKTPKVFWEFIVDEVGFRRAYLRATHKSAYEAFQKDLLKLHPLLDIDTIEVKEYMGDIDA